jgi:hypothetical protein
MDWAEAVQKRASARRRARMRQEHFTVEGREAGLGFEAESPSMCPAAYGSFPGFYEYQGYFQIAIAAVK